MAGNLDRRKECRNVGSATRANRFRRYHLIWHRAVPCGNIVVGAVSGHRIVRHPRFSRVIAAGSFGRRPRRRFLAEIIAAITISAAWKIADGKVCSRTGIIGIGAAAIVRNIALRNRRDSGKLLRRFGE